MRSATPGDRARRVGSYLKSYGLDFDVISPFVAVTYTKADTSSTRERQVRAGFSVNISKALDWLK